MKSITLEELEARWNASKDQFNQWGELGLDEIVAFAQSECLSDAGKKFAGILPHNWVCSDGYSNGLDIAEELLNMSKIDLK